MRKIGRKVAEIQNEGLGEHRLRDLNDEINKLIREKTHWERRIVELGGPNYTRHSAKMTDLDGNIVDVPNPGGRGPGYRYFGAAKKLPGVKELFEKPPELRNRRTRYDIYKRIDASYYGYRDDEDGILEKLEGLVEEKVRVAAAVADWMEMEEIKKEARRALFNCLLLSFSVWCRPPLTGHCSTLPCLAANTPFSPLQPEKEKEKTCVSSVLLDSWKKGAQELPGTLSNEMIPLRRFFKQSLAFTGVHQTALSLFRFVAALGRIQVVANTLGTFTLPMVFVLGGFVVAKGP
ncbi:mRNA splicing factor [Forsythia ovata]|uniref:mRNA splicing factor n=1 Tax=Forsythia ovata TaxID=205694 RepID=A0ABD1WUX8_9LAMI